MADPVADADFLLALLNSAPVMNGVPTDDLAEPGRARAWLASLGGAGTEAELRQVRKVRAGLQAVVRGTEPPDVLAPVLHGAAYVPALDGGQISWRLKVVPERDLAVRAVLAWDMLAKTSPGPASPVRQRRTPPVPHRPQQGGHRTVVLDGRVRQPDEGPPPLRTGPEH